MFFVSSMRKKDKGEKFAHAYILRPVVWFVYQFSSEARFIRRYQREYKKGL